MAFQTDSGIKRHPRVQHLQRAGRGSSIMAWAVTIGVILAVGSFSWLEWGDIEMDNVVTSSTLIR
jgi:hypothetical protein